MQICDATELLNFCQRNNIAVNLNSENIQKIPSLVKEINEDRFWQIAGERPWLLNLFPFNGQPKTWAWSEFCQLVPRDWKIKATLLPTALFWEVLEIFVWWFFAPVFSNLQLDLQDTLAVSNRADAEKTKRKFLAIASEGQSLDIYLRQIGQIPLITQAEEIRLAESIRQGDRLAEWSLIQANLRFVVSVAKYYQNRGLDLADLINEGNLGLIKAAKRFDETRGFRFISYAVWWIRQSILTALAENSRTVRIPLNRVGALTKINQAKAEIEQILGRAASVEEVAQAVELAEVEVVMTMELNKSAISLDAPVTEDGDESLSNILPDEKTVSPHKPALRTSLTQEVVCVLDTLTPREAEVISLYFGLNQEVALTLEEIGARFSLTRERVRQIKEKALRKLRKPNRSRNLQSYWLNSDA
ncbi:RNA polymerase sigma factor RpoD/SigA [Candidatus Parcubacteria bacterium]|nr:MAG: RNA polymerase sigma factor RpoD/SigA [Candidatus Parcubacteria bacterium]